MSEARESPALAQTILSLVMATTTAVEPATNSSGVAGLFTYSSLYLSS
jgi:hypothetical protein